MTQTRSSTNIFKKLFTRKSKKNKSGRRAASSEDRSTASSEGEQLSLNESINDDKPTVECCDDIRIQEELRKKTLEELNARTLQELRVLDTQPQTLDSLEIVKTVLLFGVMLFTMKSIVNLLDALLSVDGHHFDELDLLRDVTCDGFGCTERRNLNLTSNFIPRLLVEIAMGFTAMLVSVRKFVSINTKRFLLHFSVASVVIVGYVLRREMHHRYARVEL